MNPEAQKRSPLSYVEVTEQKRLNEAREQAIPWKGDPTSVSGSGARYARITALTAMHGITSRTINPDHAPIGGEKMGWPVSPTTSSSFVSRWRCGTGATPF